MTKYELRNQQVFVVTGPLFLPVLTPRGYKMDFPLIGQVPNLVAVPTHYFKVVLAESKARNLLGMKPVRSSFSFNPGAALERSNMRALLFSVRNPPDYWTTPLCLPEAVRLARASRKHRWC
jgi:hypothetical protein